MGMFGGGILKANLASSLSWMLAHYSKGRKDHGDKDHLMLWQKIDTMANVSILCGNCTCTVTLLIVYWKLL